MKFFQLRYFMRVYQEGSMLQAAQSLFLTQQAVSKAICELEKDLGVTLFKRTGTGVIATETGHFFAQEVSDILNQVDQLKCQIHRFSQEVKGHVKIGFLQGHLGSEGYMPIQGIRDIQSNYPGIKIETSIMTNDILIQDLTNRKLDLIFTHGPEEFKGLKSEKVYDFSWYMAMRVDHPYSRRGQLGPEDLAEQRILYLKQEVKMRNAIQDYFDEEKQPKFLLIDQSMPASLVQQELYDLDAIRFIASPFVDHIDRSLFAAVPIKWDFLKSQVFFVHRPEGVSESAKIVKRELLKAWRD